MATKQNNRSANNSTSRSGGGRTESRRVESLDGSAPVRASNEQPKSNPDATDRRRQSNRRSRGSAGQAGRHGRGDGAAEQDLGGWRGAGSKIASTVREHPLPALMIGTGLTLLLLENRGFKEVESRIAQGGKRALESMGEAIVSAAGTTRDALGGVASTVGHGVESAAETVREGAGAIGQYAQSGASAVAGGVRDAASALGEKSQQGFRQGRVTGEELWERHPLATSAAILTAGIAAGMLLPTTRRENQVIRPALQGVTEKIGEKASELLERGRDMIGGGSSPRRSSNSGGTRPRRRGSSK